MDVEILEFLVLIILVFTSRCSIFFFPALLFASVFLFHFFKISAAISFCLPASIGLDVLTHEIYLLIWKTGCSSPSTLGDSLRGVSRLISSREVPHLPLPLVCSIASRHQLNLNFLLKVFEIKNRGNSDSRPISRLAYGFQGKFSPSPMSGQRQRRSRCLLRVKGDSCLYLRWTEPSRALPSPGKLSLVSPVILGFPIWPTCQNNIIYAPFWSFPGGSAVKNLPANPGDISAPELGSSPGDGSGHLLHLPGKSHGQRNLVGCSPWGH